MRKLFIIVVVCIAVLLTGYAGYRGYKVWKNKHLVSLGRDFMASSDRRAATLSAEEVLKSDPKNIDATRMMAQLSEASHSPGAVLWRSRVVELNPHSAPDRLALAQTALTVQDFATADNALEGIEQGDRTTEEYHNVAGMVAAAENKFPVAEEHFVEAARLEPTNLAPQLNLSVVRLHSTNSIELMEARSTLQQISVNTANSGLRCQALRELTLDAMRHKQFDTAVALANKLTLDTGASQEDRILHLEVLLETRNSGLSRTLAAYQHDSSTNAGKIYQLASWEMTKLSPADAMSWLRTLPLSVQTNQPTTLLIAQCYVSAKDWRGLQTWLGNQRWTEMEFIRHALLSRAMQSQNLTASAKTEWDQAFKLANNQKQSLIMLLRLDAEWGWESQGEDILWTLVNRYPQEQWAKRALTRSLMIDGQTRSLMELFNQELQRSPTDLAAMNNLATVALLLDAKEYKPQDLARQVYNQAPTNSAFATTYAFSLYLQGKNADALKVMQGINPTELESPSIAGYYGLILKASGDKSRARTYLDSTSKIRLLPEERRLFADARSGI